MSKRIISAILCLFLLPALAAVSPSYALDSQAKPIQEKLGNVSAIEISTANDGYFSAKYTGGGTNKIKLIVEKSDGKYTYDLNNRGEYEIYPLQLGSGSYKIRILRNTVGTKYAVVQSLYLDVALSSQYAPFLHSSQYVNYNESSFVVQTAAQLTKDISDNLKKVDVIYDYVVNAMSYDTQKASSVTNGYLPKLDLVIEAKKGICFDYAAVMAAMLRSQNIPTKLVTGYVAPSNAYHAWNEVYIENIGWIKTGSLYFDGKKWTTMDPTFTSAAKSSRKISEFIGDSSNYSKKYEY